MSFQSILVAVDESPIAARAARVAEDLARSLHARLGFVHVVDSTLGYAPEAGVPTADLIEDAQREGERLVVAFAQRASVDPAPREFVVIGKPAAAIAKAASEWAADLIVIGSHGRHGLGRMLLGSVAESVVRAAHCPVLVIRAPE